MLAEVLDPANRCAFRIISIRALAVQVAKEKGLEGILAKRRDSQYCEGRSREWLKIKITQTVDCVIGGYTDPEGSREYFGSIVLGCTTRKNS